MVLIITSLGASNRYADRSMLRTTFRNFINSLLRQIDPSWRCFISCHDIVEIDGWTDSRIIWCSMRCDHDSTMTIVPTVPPSRLTDDGVYEKMPYDCGITDMGRKNLNSSIEAGRWAYRNDLDGFWMVRMDTDDMMNRSFVGYLNDLVDAGGPMVRAVYNRVCYMYDPRTDVCGVKKHPWSTTINALWHDVDADTLVPDWYYQDDDHTRFWNRIQRDGIPSRELNGSLCITVNSGNHLSERPPIRREPRIRIVPTEPIRIKFGFVPIGGNDG